MRKSITLIAVVNFLIILVLYFLKQVWAISYLDATDIEIYYPRFFSSLIFAKAYLPFDVVSECAGKLFVCLMLFSFVFNVVYLFAIIKKHKDAKTASLFFISLTFSFILLEIVLRLYDFKPGLHTWNKYFVFTDNLILYKGFVADENGIFKIDKATGKIISERILKKQKVINENETTEIYGIIHDFVDVKNREVHNDFSKKFISILNKPEEKWSPLDAAIVNYINCPINDDGFRSISFEKFNNTKPSILLLGDSFTWGHTTKNKTNSFADILLSKGYTVYNTGITGTDVAQYLAIAKKYIPILKPDYVIVNFYIGNDITYYKRDVKPYQPVFYCTNAGNIMACPFGNCFLNAETAFNSLLNQWKIPTNNRINLLFTKTTLTSILWSLLHKIDLIPYLSISNNAVQQNNINKYKTPYSNVELKEIEKIAVENQSKFVLSSIPEIYIFSEKKAKDFSDLFTDIDFIEMKTNKLHYNLRNAHFNERGHEKYAEFLDSIITNTEK